MIRALVLSGGGSHGAAQIGALKHLIFDLNRQYDILCGVSVGALNVGFLSMFSKEQEKEGLQQLLDFWLTVDNSKVWKRWFPFGKLHALWLKSLFNSQPLIDTVHQSLDLNKIRKSGRQVTVGTVSLTTGKYRSFTQDDDDFIDGVLASSAFPTGLKPIMIGSELYTDGGVKHITPLTEAIDLGATDVDVIMCAPAGATGSYDNQATTPYLGLRTIDLMSDEIMENDLKMAGLYNRIVQLDPETDKRFINIKIARPEFPLGSGSLDFNPQEIKTMIDQGYEIAQKMEW